MKETSLTWSVAPSAGYTGAGLLVRYRHPTYALSQDPLIAEVLSRSEEMDRTTALEVYPLMYSSLSGNLSGASLHIASLTTTPSLSTHLFPSVYGPVNPQEGIYRAAGEVPEQAVLFTHSYVNNKGETANFSFAKIVNDVGGNRVGYVIVDLFKSYLSEQLRESNNRFFVDIVVTDNVGFQVVDLFHPENDGDYSGFPYLQSINTRTSGAEVVGDMVVGWRPIMDGRLTVVAVVMARHISSPVQDLAAAMERVQKGDLHLQIRTERRDEIGSLFRGLIDKTVEEQEALRVAELKSLQAQINPHFLYNTLGTIKSIAKLRAVPEIVTITSELSNLLRAGFDAKPETKRLADSIALVRSFVNIQNQRHPNRYTVTIDVDERIMNHTIPPLILQPIVENAFVHGLERKIGPGNLSITGSVVDGRISIVVRDDGVGFDPNDLDDGATHIGLVNVDRRLKLLFGPEYGLTIESSPGAGCAVEVRIPVHDEKETV